MDLFKNFVMKFWEMMEEYERCINFFYSILKRKMAAFLTCRAVRKRGNARLYSQSRKKSEETALLIFAIFFLICWGHKGHTGFNDTHAKNQSPFASFLMFRRKIFTGYILSSLLFNPIIFFVKLEFNMKKIG